MCVCVKMCVKMCVCVTMCVCVQPLSGHGEDFVVLRVGGGLRPCVRMSEGNLEEIEKIN